MNDKQLNALVEKAIKAKENAYCPYSKFRVGCALLTNDDIIYTGCNVENASFGLTICAERTALCKAASDGHRQFKAIAVTTDITETFVAPCGACRQFIAEFGPNIEIIMVKNKDEVKRHKIHEILPFIFDQSSLAMNSKDSNGV